MKSEGQLSCPSNCALNSVTRKCQLSRVNSRNLLVTMSHFDTLNLTWRLEGAITFYTITWTIIIALSPHNDIVICLTFSPDERIINRNHEHILKHCNSTQIYLSSLIPGILNALGSNWEDVEFSENVMAFNKAMTVAQVHAKCYPGLSGLRAPWPCSFTQIWYWMDSEICFS